MNIDDKYSDSLKRCIASRKKQLQKAIEVTRREQHRLATYIFTEELNDLKAMEASING